MVELLAWNPIVNWERYVFSFFLLSNRAERQENKIEMKKEPNFSKARHPTQILLMCYNSILKTALCFCIKYDILDSIWLRFFWGTLFQGSYFYLLILRMVLSYRLSYSNRKLLFSIQYYIFQRGIPLKSHSDAIQSTLLLFNSILLMGSW